LMGEDVRNLLREGPATRWLSTELGRSEDDLGT
jgi:hypothetical protein